MRTLRFVIVFFLILVSGGFFYVTAEVDIQTFILNLLEHSHENAIVIVLVITGLTIFSTASGLPVFYFSVALGFLLPFLPAIGLAWIINLVAVMITYIMVKKVFSASFRSRYGQKKMIRKINERIRKYGPWTVAMSRGIYIIPTNILNFSFPLSRITARQYLAGTMAGLVPECLVNTGTGYLLRHQFMLLSEPQQNLLKSLVIGGFLVLMIAAFLYLRFRKKKIEQESLSEIVPMPEDE